jgi:hypothetical protein
MPAPIGGGVTDPLAGVPADIPWFVEMMGLREGWGAKPDNLPTRQNNPLDLMHAPDETHPADAPNSIGSFSDAATGWERGLRQCQLWASRGLTVAQAMAIQAPPPINDTAAYIAFMCARVGCTPDTLMTDALKISDPGTLHG